MSSNLPLGSEPPALGELSGLSCAQLVSQLALQPHPEGGWYREVHRSSVQVRRADGVVRCALTQILYLLPAGGISRWHRVCGADEIWELLGGEPLQLWMLPPGGGTARGALLKPLQPPGLEPCVLHGGAGLRIRGFRAAGLQASSRSTYRGAT